MERLGDILKRQGQGPTIPPGFPAHEGRRNRGERSLPLPEDGECPRCGGVGYLYPALPEDHPDYGRAVPCTCAEQAQDAERLARLQRYSNLGPLLETTFDTISPFGRSATRANQEQFSRALEAARAYALDPQGWFVLVGASGSGKTQIAAAIATAAMQRGIPSLFMVVPDLLDHLRAAFAPQSDTSYDDLFDQVRNAPLLLLDDLGSQSSTPWAQEKLFQLLNHRYTTRLPTVVTLGVPVDQIDERLRYRFTDPASAQLWELEPNQEALLEYRGALPASLLARMTFQTFDLKGMEARPDQMQSLRYAYQAARNFAAQPEGWLLLSGPVGCGKTHLAVAVANYRLQQGDPVVFQVVPDLLDHLRATFAPDSRVTYDDLFDRVRNAALLILDDLGNHVTSDWAQEKLFQLINHRYNNRLPTVITTSLDRPQASGGLSPAIASRLADPFITLHVVIDAPDYRLLPERAPERVPQQPRPPRAGRGRPGSAR